MRPEGKQNHAQSRSNTWHSTKAGGEVHWLCDNGRLWLLTQCTLHMAGGTLEATSVHLCGTASQLYFFISTLQFCKSNNDECSGERPVLRGFSGRGDWVIRVCRRRTQGLRRSTAASQDTYSFHCIFLVALKGLKVEGKANSQGKQLVRLQCGFAASSQFTDTSCAGLWFLWRPQGKRLPEEIKTSRGRWLTFDGRQLLKHMYRVNVHTHTHISLNLHTTHQVERKGF